MWIEEHNLYPNEQGQKEKEKRQQPIHDGEILQQLERERQRRRRTSKLYSHLLANLYNQRICFPRKRKLYV